MAVADCNIQHLPTDYKCLSLRPPFTLFPLSPRTNTQMEWSGGSRSRSSSPPAPVARAALDRAEHAVPTESDLAEHTASAEPGVAEHLAAAAQVCVRYIQQQSVITAAPRIPPQTCGIGVHHPPSPKQHIEARSIEAARPTFGPASASFQDQAKVRHAQM